MIEPTCVSHWPMSMVYPSGAARAMRATPIVPPAPPTFSTTTVWPSGARMRSAMMRAAVSVEPPGGNGTTRVIGREGNPCACAAAAQAANAIAATKFIALPSVQCETTDADRFLPQAQEPQAAGLHQGVPDAARGDGQERDRPVGRRFLLPLAHRAGEGRGELRQVRPRLRRVLAGRRDDSRHRSADPAGMA